MRKIEEICNDIKELTSKYSANQINIYNEPGKIKKLIQIIRTKQNIIPTLLF